jgi:hypothetical protein
MVIVNIPLGKHIQSFDDVHRLVGDITDLLGCDSEELELRPIATGNNVPMLNIHEILEAIETYVPQEKTEKAKETLVPQIEANYYTLPIDVAYNSVARFF